MTKHYPQEFQDDVVRVARLRQSPIRQIARDFGISAGTLYQWLAKVEGENAGAPNSDQLVANRDLRRRNRVLEQEVEIGAKSNCLLRQRSLPKMIYPLVRELAEDGIAIRLTRSGSWILSAGLLQVAQKTSLPSRL